MQSTNRPSGKNIVITGANRGIGFETMKELYLVGNNVIFGCRTLNLNDEAIQAVKRCQIKQSSQNSFNSMRPMTQPLLLSFHLDLSHKESVKKFSQSIKQHFKHIDILINNAGIAASKLQIVQQLQVQKTLAVNYYGHFYLTHLLFPLLVNSPDARIINVSSRFYQFVRKKFLNDFKCELKLFETNKQLFISKFMLVVFTYKLAQVLGQNGIGNVKVFSVDPGTVMTSFAEEQCERQFFKSICCCFYKTPYEGARTTLYLATEDKNKLKSGSFYDEAIQIKELDPRATKQENIEEIWTRSHQAYGLVSFF